MPKVCETHRSAPLAPRRTDRAVPPPADPSEKRSSAAAGLDGAPAVAPARLDLPAEPCESRCRYPTLGPRSWTHPPQTILPRGQFCYRKNARKGEFVGSDYSQSICAKQKNCNGKRAAHAVSGRRILLGWLVR